MGLTSKTWILWFFNSCHMVYQINHFQHFNWTSLVVQRLKRLPAMWETWVRSLGREYPLEKEMATHSSILPWRIPWTEELGGLQSTGRKESDTTERLLFHFNFCMLFLFLNYLFSQWSLSLSYCHFQFWCWMASSS